MLNHAQFYWKVCAYALGDGRNIQIWRVPSLPRFVPVAREETNFPANIVTVRDLCVEEGRQWNEGLLRELFEPISMDAILRLRLEEAGPADHVF